MVDATSRGRLACQRDHSATGRRRSAAIDPPLPAERLKADGPRQRSPALTQPMLDFLSHCVKAR
jgi:hypothetical protein